MYGLDIKYNETYNSILLISHIFDCSLTALEKVLGKRLRCAMTNFENVCCCISLIPWRLSYTLKLIRSRAEVNSVFAICKVTCDMQTGRFASGQVAGKWSRLSTATSLKFAKE